MIFQVIVTHVYFPGKRPPVLSRYIYQTTAVEIYILINLIKSPHVLIVIINPVL